MLVWLVLDVEVDAADDTMDALVLGVKSIDVDVDVGVDPMAALLLWAPFVREMLMLMLSSADAAAGAGVEGRRSIMLVKSSFC